MVSACVSARTASEPLTGSPIMATPDIPKSWTPTAENLWALPKPLRRYIHHLQSNVDHVETMRKTFGFGKKMQRSGKSLPDSSANFDYSSPLLLFRTERLVPGGSSEKLFAVP